MTIPNNNAPPAKLAVAEALYQFAAGIDLRDRELLMA
jgi:hypothetical protein